jgi:cysteine desulfurase
MKKLHLPIYLDYQATTPTDQRVVEAMLPYFNNKFGNAHSRGHSFGWDAEEAVDIARKQVADLIGAEAKEIIFTSGATESNNLAIKGVARFYKDQGKNHIITVCTEHKCVLDTCRHLSEEGFNITYLPVNKNGTIDLELLENAITDKTILVSVMMVNNEIGIIQPIKQIGEICRKHQVFFHSDCAQSFGKVPIDVNDLNIDMLSISGHKIYGPKGIGALYVRKKNPRVRIKPLINGGGQERGMRSGTLPTPLVVGLGKAAEIAKEVLYTEYDYIKKLSDKFYQSIVAKIPDIYQNGDKDQGYPGCLNISFAYIEGESLMIAMRDLAVSSGSACTSASLEPSYVLRALGVEEELAHTSIRFGIGRFTTEEEINYAIDLISKSIHKLREMSPLWEMAQEGIDLKSIQWSGH